MSYRDSTEYFAGGLAGAANPPTSKLGPLYKTVTKRRAGWPRRRRLRRRTVGRASLRRGRAAARIALGSEIERPDGFIGGGVAGAASLPTG